MNIAAEIIDELFLVNLAWAIVRIVITSRMPLSMLAFYAIGTACCVSVAAIRLLQHNWFLTSTDSVAAIVWVRWLWKEWKKRPRRKGRLAALGNKARARIAEMKRKMAERPARPVLRPVPQGGAA